MNVAYIITDMSNIEDTANMAKTFLLAVRHSIDIGYPPPSPLIPIITITSSSSY